MYDGRRRLWQLNTQAEPKPRKARKSDAPHLPLGKENLELARLRQEESNLRTANQRLNEFLAIAGHELRTPLTTILGTAQLAQCLVQQMQQDIHDPALYPQFEELQSMLQDADYHARRLSRLVNDILDVARIDRGHLHLHAELGNLEALIYEVVRKNQRVWPGRTISVQIPQEQGILVLMDRDRIAQVVTNFLVNALKYAPTEEPIDIIIQHASAQVRVAVQDRGPGLPPNEQQMIWERFYQVKGIEAQQGSNIGLGLGLYLSKSIITQHGGKVGVESQPGKGSIFWFTLPFRAETTSQRDPPAESELLSAPQSKIA
jgi:signal transduction histidine kinase